MKTFSAIAMLAGALCSNAAMAHIVVKQSVPNQGARLTASPPEANIVFSEKVEKMFSSATLNTGAGAAVPGAKSSIDAANGALLRMPLPSLKPGAYVIKWTAVGRDGHRRSGDIRFSVL